MTIATLFSRCTGLLRTWAMAFALGNTLITSSYQVANNLPNVVFELVAGGLLSAAFLPVLMLQFERKGQDGFNRFGSNILNICLVVLGALSILATIFAEQVVATQTFTIGDDAAVSLYAVNFFRIFAIQIVFYGLGGVITGILNSQRSYFLTSIAPAINNICVIVAFFAYIPLSATDENLALTVLAVGTTLGVAAQFIVQIPALRKTGFTYIPRIDFKDPALVETLKIAVPTLIYIVGNLIAFSCRNAFSLLGGDDGPSVLSYAWIWYQLPYGVVAVSLSRAMFTEMSSSAAKEDWGGLRKGVNRGLRGTLFMIIPLAGMVFVLSDQLMQIFKAGAFDQDSVYVIGNILRMWIISLPIYSVVMYLYNAFASIRKFLAFAVLNCILVGVQVGLYALLCPPENLALAGVPVADFCYYFLEAAIALALLRHYTGSFKLSNVFSMTARVSLATVIGMFACGVMLVIVPFTSESIAIALVQIVLCGGVGLVVTFGACYVLRVDEMSIITGLFGKIKGKLARS